MTLSMISSKNICLGEFPNIYIVFIVFVIFLTFVIFVMFMSFEANQSALLLQRCSLLKILLALLRKREWYIDRKIQIKMFNQP